MRAIGRMSPYTVHLGADVFLLALSGSVIKLNKMRQDASYANVPFPLVLYRSCGNCHGQSRVLLLVPYTVVGTVYRCWYRVPLLVRTGPSNIRGDPPSI
jgi:hypothetical protein